MGPAIAGTDWATARTGMRRHVAVVGEPTNLVKEPEAIRFLEGTWAGFAECLSPWAMLIWSLNRSAPGYFGHWVV